MKVAIKVIKTETPYKVLDISGAPGDALSNHKVNEGALLLMRAGSIIYKEDGKMKTLSAGDSYDIPANVFHNVTCTTKAKFFIIMTDQTKMKFKKDEG